MTATHLVTNQQETAGSDSNRTRQVAATIDGVLELAVWLWERLLDLSIVDGVDCTAMWRHVHSMVQGTLNAKQVYYGALSYDGQIAAWIPTEGRDRSRDDLMSVSYTRRQRVLKG